MVTVRKLLFIAILLSPVSALAKQNMTANSTTYSISQTIKYLDLLDKTKVPQQNGTMAYCSDCKQTPICVPQGKGAMATLVNGTWQCGLGIQGSSVAGAGNINQGSIGQYAGYVGPDNYTIGPMPNPLDFYTGPISITGNQINGQDQINGVSVNGEMSASAFGAVGDGIYSGDYTHAADASTTAGGTQVNIPSTMLTNKYIGDAIFVDGAGASGVTYVGTITSILGTEITVTPATPTAIMNASYVIGFDNTGALQNWLNLLRSQGVIGEGLTPPPHAGYLPGPTPFTNTTTGVYVTRGLNWGGTQGVTVRGAGFSNSAGGGNSGGSTILCMLPGVNPKGIPSGQVGCNDFTGAQQYTIRDLRFKNGNTFAGAIPGPESGYYNVLLARHPTAGFAISNTFQNVSFQSWGQYNVVISNSEQNSWINDTFNDDGNTSIGVYITTNNTFLSPFYGTLAGAGQSTTINRFSGGATQFSANGYWGSDTGQCSVVMDGGPNDIAFDDAYVRLNGDYDSFICDSAAGATPGEMSLSNLRIEPDTIGVTTSHNQLINFAQANSGWNGGELHNISWGLPCTTSACTAIVPASLPLINIPNGTLASVNFSSLESNSWPNPLVKVKSAADNSYGNLNAAWIQVNGKVLMPVGGTRRAFDGALGAYTSGSDGIGFELNSSSTGANDWQWYSSATGSSAPWGPGGMGWNFGGTSAGGFTNNGTFVDNVGVTTSKLVPGHMGCPPGVPPPTVSVGNITGTSCDSFGAIGNVTGGSTTITFHTPFTSQVFCTVVDAGQPYAWVVGGGDGSHNMIFYCTSTVNGTNTPCPGAQTVVYTCFSTGAP